MRTPQKKTLGGQTVRKIQKIQMVESRKHKAEELDTSRLYVEWQDLVTVCRPRRVSTATQLIVEQTSLIKMKDKK